jgi:hypothetical protein
LHFDFAQNALQALVGNVLVDPWLVDLRFELVTELKEENIMSLPANAKCNKDVAVRTFMSARQKSLSAGFESGCGSTRSRSEAFGSTTT